MVSMYAEPVANIMLCGADVRVFPLQSGIRQGCLISFFLSNIVLEYLGRAMRQGR